MRVAVNVVVDGDCAGELVVVNDYISFYGEVEPATGLHKPSGKSISGKALLFRGSRGSTVGSYVIYALKRSGVEPLCMIVERAEPILVVGCVLSEIPLFVLNREDFELIVGLASEGLKVLHRRGESWIVIEK